MKGFHQSLFKTLISISRCKGLQRLGGFALNPTIISSSIIQFLAFNKCLFAGKKIKSWIGSNQIGLKVFQESKESKDWCGTKSTWKQN